MKTYHEEVGECGGDAAKRAPKEEDLGAKVRVVTVGSDQVWGDNGDDLWKSAPVIAECVQQIFTYAVPEPVGRGGDTHAAGSDWKREDLSNDHPRTRPPGGSEERDVEADEGNHSRDSGIIMFFDFASGNTNDTHDKLHDDHSRASDDEDLAATKTFDCPEGDGGGTDVDKCRDEGDEERILDRAERCEEDGSKVEDEVDTGQLLHHLHEDT